MSEQYQNIDTNVKPSTVLSSWVGQLNKKIVQAFSFDENIIEKINNFNISAEQIEPIQLLNNSSSGNQKEEQQIKETNCGCPSKKLQQLLQQTDISFKIKKSLQQLYQNIINLEEQKHLSGQDLQNNFKQQNLSQNQNIKKEQTNIEKTIQQNPSQSRLHQVKQFFTDLNQRVIVSYQGKHLQILLSLVEEIYLNNSYQCMQSTFQLLKSKYRTQRKNIQRKNSNIKDSMKKSQTSDIQFNMELTMKSRNSNKNSYIDRHDSLVYSNATSFGLQNTQNRSSDIKRKSNSKNQQNQGQQLQMIVIDRTSSRGEVDNEERYSSSKSFSDNQKATKGPPRFSYQDNSNRSNKTNHRLSSQESTERKVSQLEIQKSPILQEDTYQVQKSENSSFKQDQGSDKKQVNKFNIKKQVNMTHSQSKKKIVKSSMPVFTSEIQNLQGKINKIKQAKLLKKKKLEDELAKLNKQIVQLKVQEPQQQFQQIHQIRVPPNAYESRIKINDDLESKEKAENLVKNLRSQKKNRQQVKRHQHKVLDMNLHQQMEEIMKMRYFNQERIKQKKKLEIIERMKKQQIRKITQQKLKQASSHFLVKLKPSAVRVNNKNTIDYQNPIQEQLTQQNNDHMATPGKNLNLSRKKQYSNLSKNFNILKQHDQDKYEQTLN